MTSRLGLLAASAVSLCACKGDREPPPAPPPPGPPIPAAAVLVDAAPEAVPADAAADAGGTGDVVVSIDGKPHPLRFGIASGSVEGLVIQLFSEPAACSAQRFSDPSGGDELSFKVPPGPGGTYFAGHAVSTTMLVQAFDERTQIPAGLARGAGVPGMSFPKALGIGGAAGSVTLERVTPRAHAHVRGTVEGLESSLLGTAEVHGHFDVELCDDVEGAPLRATAPTGPIRGHRGQTALVPRTIHAMVMQRAASHDEAIETAIDRGDGSLAEIWRLVFYAAANVPCPPHGKEHNEREAVVVMAQGIGGTSRAHPSLGTPQPTSIELFGAQGPPNDVTDVWPAWVQIEAPLDFTAGAKLHGMLWAESAHDDDVKGTFGGHFEATVCGP